MSRNDRVYKFLDSLAQSSSETNEVDKKIIQFIFIKNWAMTDKYFSGTFMLRFL